MSNFVEENNSMKDNHSPENLKKEVSKIEGQIQMISTARQSIKDETTLHLLLQGIHIPEEFKSQIDMESLIGKVGDQELVSIYKNSSTMKGGVEDKGAISSEEIQEDDIVIDIGGISEKLAQILTVIQNSVSKYLNDCLANDIDPDFSFINSIVESINNDNFYDITSGLNMGEKSAQDIKSLQDDLNEIKESGIDNDRFKSKLNEIKTEGKYFEFDDLMSALKDSLKGGENKVDVKINDTDNSVNFSNLNPEQMSKIKEMLGESIAPDNTTPTPTPTPNHSARSSDREV